MTSEKQSTVLIVEDERDLADLYAAWLADTYSVRTAYGGEEALERMDDTVDVVLLDRQMPDLSGKVVLREIRERGYECRVAMVTAIDPDLDIIEMGFDDYLTKPVSEDDLHAVVDRLLTLVAYDDHFQEYYAVASKKATLDAQHGEDYLNDSDEYAALEARLADLEEQLDATLDELDRGDEGDQPSLIALLRASDDGERPRGDIR